MAPVAVAPVGGAPARRASSDSMLTVDRSASRTSAPHRSSSLTISGASVSRARRRRIGDRCSRSSAHPSHKNSRRPLPALQSRRRRNADARRVVHASGNDRMRVRCSAQPQSPFRGVVRSELGGVRRTERRRDPDRPSEARPRFDPRPAPRRSPHLSSRACACHRICNGCPGRRAPRRCGGGPTGGASSTSAPSSWPSRSRRRPTRRGIGLPSPATSTSTPRRTCSGSRCCRR